MLETLVRAYPNSISYEHLVWSLWGDDPSGGPESPSAIRVVRHRLRKRLLPLGWDIRSLGGAGRGETRLIKLSS